MLCNVLLLCSVVFFITGLVIGKLGYENDKYYTYTGRMSSEFNFFKYSSLSLFVAVVLFFFALQSA